MRPQQSSIFSFIQTRNPHAVPVRRNMFRHNVHGNLAEIQIRADPRRRRDSRRLQHIPDDLSRKFLRRHLIRVQIMRHIHKHLVNRVHMHILRCHVFQINVINASAVFQIFGHLRRCCHVICPDLRTIFQFNRIDRASCKCTVWRFPLSAGIDLLHLLYHLKESRSSRNPISLHRW